MFQFATKSPKFLKLCTLTPSYISGHLAHFHSSPCLLCHLPLQLEAKCNCWALSSSQKHQTTIKHHHKTPSLHLCNICSCLKLRRRRASLKICCCKPWITHAIHSGGSGEDLRTSHLRNWARKQDRGYRWRIKLWSSVSGIQSSNKFEDLCGCCLLAWEFPSRQSNC